jgi:D-glycero-alpha-D-manno-heptose-7-phosphate kinase
MLDNLHFVKQIGCETRRAFESGDLRCFAELMHLHWQRKRQRTAGMSNTCIDGYYDLARRNGTLGGKLIGAGGGGFLMFYTEDKTRLRCAMTEVGLREVGVRFDFQGTTVMVRG